MGYMSGLGSVSPSSRYIISVIWTRVPGVRTQERGCRHFYYQQYQHSHCLVHVSSKPDRRIEDEVMFTFFLLYILSLRWDGMGCDHIVLIDVLVGTNFDIFKWGLYSVYCVARTIDLFAFFFVCKQPEYL